MWIFSMPQISRHVSILFRIMFWLIFGQRESKKEKGNELKSKGGEERYKEEGTQKKEKEKEKEKA